jgi:hypothetical protein
MFGPKKCANMACTCLAPDKKKYCSDHCEGMGSKMEIMCLCGHADCSASMIHTDSAHEHDSRPGENLSRGSAQRP